jgi:hydrogenase maturation protease
LVRKCDVPPILVIGYGNELRGDDAAGPRVATAIEKLGLAGVQVLVRHQLAPELSEAISQARAIVFVDAALAGEGVGVKIVPLQGVSSARIDPHYSDPPAVLGLARELFGRSPPAWLVTVPGRCFDFGVPLSRLAERGVATALVEIQKLILQSDLK